MPLSSDGVRVSIDDGLGDATTPRLFVTDERSAEADGHELAAIDGRPAFLVGLRSVPKPVAPFGTTLATAVEERRGAPPTPGWD